MDFLRRKTAKKPSTLNPVDSKAVALRGKNPEVKPKFTTSPTIDYKKLAIPKSPPRRKPTPVKSEVKPGFLEKLGNFLAVVFNSFNIYVVYIFIALCGALLVYSIAGYLFSWKFLLPVGFIIVLYMGLSFYLKLHAIDSQTNVQVSGQNYTYLATKDNTNIMLEQAKYEASTATFSIEASMEKAKLQHSEEMAKIQLNEQSKSYITYTQE